MCIQRDANVFSRRKRWRALFSKVTGENWMEDAHVMFFSSLRQTCGQVSFARRPDDPDPSGAYKFQATAPLITEWIECGLIEMCLAVLTKLLGTYHEVHNGNWSRLRLMFLARQEEGNLFTLLDQPLFEKITLLASEFESANDRSHLDREWFAEDQNVFVPSYILKSLGSLLLAEVPAWNKKMMDNNIIAVVKPFVFNALTPLEVVDAMRVMSSLSAAGKPSRDAVFADQKILNKMAMATFDGAFWGYRDIMRVFFSEDLRGIFPYYWHDLVLQMADPGSDESMDLIVGLTTQQADSGGFLINSMEPRHVPAVLKTAFPALIGQMSTKYSKLLRSSDHISHALDAFIMNLCTLDPNIVSDFLLESDGVLESLLQLISSETNHSYNLALALCVTLSQMNEVNDLSLRLYNAVKVLVHAHPSIWSTLHEKKVFPLRDLRQFEKNVNLELHYLHDFDARFKAEIAERMTLCSACGAGGDLKSCGRCRAVKYCTLECQKKDFKRHKVFCAAGDVHGVDPIGFTFKARPDLSTEESLAVCPILCREERYNLTQKLFREEMAKPVRNDAKCREAFVILRILSATGRDSNIDLSDSDTELAFSIFQEPLEQSSLVKSVIDVDRHQQLIKEKNLLHHLQMAEAQFGPWCHPWDTVQPDIEYTGVTCDDLGL